MMPLSLTKSGTKLIARGLIANAPISIAIDDHVATVSQTGNDDATLDLTTAVDEDKVLTPGSTGPGSWTETSQPADVGNYTAAGYTQSEPAIARWDVVPYQTFDGTFNVGVVAFHSSGISKVSFSVNGGTWVDVTTPTANPQTANTSGIGRANASGVVEYWATLRASDFATDGPVEVRAIAYPVVGTPRVLQGATIGADGIHSLYLNANNGGAIPTLSKYVSPTGNDTTGNGTAETPYATIYRAAKAIQDEAGSTYRANNGTIYMAAGNYDWAGKAVNGGYNAPEISTSTGWLTIAPAPGVSASQVAITTGGAADDMLHTKLVRCKGITISTSLRQSNDLNSMIWFDGCILTGSGPSDETEWAGSTSWNGGKWVTDSTVGNADFGVASALLQRNVAVRNIGSDAFTQSKMVINCTAENIQVPAGKEYHPDVLQLYGIFSNVVYYGITATQNITAQGLFIDAASFPTSLTDAAFVNININNQAIGPSDLQVFQFCAPCVNVYIKGGNFVGPANWRVDLGFSADDVVVENTTFSPDSVSPITGVTIR